MLVWGWLVVLFGWLFLLGSAVGSFLNVCIFRLPRRRNLFWPSSRCGACFTPIRAADNLPLLAYWRLGGRCRACGSRFSARYFLVEAVAGVVFAGLYALEVGANVHGFGVWSFGGFSSLEAGQFPPHSWPFFAGHVVLASTLVVAAGCLRDGEEVPPGLVLAGAVCGLVWALAYPWPEPMRAGNDLRPGFMPWPVWWPLPGGPEAGGFALGLLDAAAGILLPAALVRLVDRRRRFGSAAGVSAMTGGFLGWQPLAVALALAAVLTLLASARQRVPGTALAAALSACVAVVWLGWAWLGPIARPVLFDPVRLAAAVVLLAATLLACAARTRPRA